MDTRKLLVYLFAAGFRLLLFTVFPGLPTVLTNRVEVSTPVTSFKRLQEGVYLYTHNITPYDGGIFHQAPLFLPLFSLLDPLQHPYLVNLVYITLDLLSASALKKIADTGVAYASRRYKSPRTESYSGVWIIASFLFNPFTIATCLARSTSAFTITFILQAIAGAAQGRPRTCILALGLASYLSLHPVLLAPPLLMLCYDQVYRHSPGSRRPSPYVFAVSHVLGLGAVIAGLLYASYIITESWEFLASTYGTMLLLPDLTPNVGLWWYFFIEVFDPFREYFLGVFWIYMVSYAPGFSIRFRDQPLFAIVALTGIMAIYQPYPSVADSALFLGLLPLYRHIFPLMRYSFITSAILMYATFLGPAFYHLWIYAGSGNANFFYAITLVWSLGLSFLVADTVFAVLRDESESLRPELKDADVRQM